MPRRRRAVGLTLALVLGGVVLAGCDDEGASDDPGEAQDGGGEEGGDGAPESAAPVPRPTSPADIPAAPGDRSVSVDGATITVEGDRAAFVSPTGNIACLLTDETATCQIYDKTYSPNPGDMVPDVVGPCTAAEADAMRLVEVSAAWTCVGEDAPLTSAARLDQGGWWEPEVDRDTLEIDGARVAVLPYTQTLRVGPVSCTSQETGVTCSNPELNNRRFQLSRTSYAFDRNG